MSSKKEELKTFLFKNKVDIIACLESKIKISKVEKI